ncbi:O-methyltransferase [Synergistales bacterium]|nr:O-methyltransferase [Synergistales bacterium]GHV50122.1 O-methyltransferase [Synergistales bacterium]
MDEPRNYGPQKNGAQYVEDLASAYWKSQALFTALELDLFETLERGGGDLPSLARESGLDEEALGRFLSALKILRLAEEYDGRYVNSAIAGKYLLRGSPHYMGGLILWRKYLAGAWRGLSDNLRAGGRTAFSDSGGLPDERELETRRRMYISAMDGTAIMKAEELLPIIDGLKPDRGVRILDVGAGSGAISAALLKKYPQARAVLMDIPEIIGITMEYVSSRGVDDRCGYLPANALEPWPESGKFGLIILSNIIHASGEKEAEFLLSQAAERLEARGAIIVHDFFPEHCPQKAALFDLNMLANTYNGRIFPSARIRDIITGLRLEASGLIPLESDTAVIIASNDGKIIPEGLTNPENVYTV